MHIDERLEKRLGRLHARLRFGIEADHEAQVFGQGINYFRPAPHSRLCNTHYCSMAVRHLLSRSPFGGKAIDVRLSAQQGGATVLPRRNHFFGRP